MGKVAAILKQAMIDFVLDLVYSLLYELSIGWGVFELGPLPALDPLPAEAYAQKPMTIR